eukprot:CAMPEP_0178424992 /NCGR_PEP_ID=MMETSP0689_2-20121128/28495_1 /TAXON_ID=160604 /ORGANISM="Amphidinium massartii, Strain CS-259" /LENGTH=114 /DNA_ID=CAMNT_0020046645 /DNA_START=516 /DNA_END=860 /DNA_ORIENTATION=-
MEPRPPGVEAPAADPEPNDSAGALNSSSVWAYEQFGSWQLPTCIMVLHSFVQRKSGNGRSSSAPCAKGHCGPFTHMPRTWNLQSLVLANCRVRPSRPFVLLAIAMVVTGGDGNR